MAGVVNNAIFGVYHGLYVPIRYMDFQVEIDADNPDPVDPIDLENHLVTAPISGEVDNQVCQLECRHTFIFRNIARLLQEGNGNCPLCRRPISQIFVKDEHYPRPPANDQALADEQQHNLHEPLVHPLNFPPVQLHMHPVDPIPLQHINIDNLGLFRPLPFWTRMLRESLIGRCILSIHNPFLRIVVTAIVALVSAMIFIVSGMFLAPLLGGVHTISAFLVLASWSEWVLVEKIVFLTCTILGITSEFAILCSFD